MRPAPWATQSTDFTVVPKTNKYQLKKERSFINVQDPHVPIAQAINFVQIV
jgi:hypothetical protein